MVPLFTGLSFRSSVYFIENKCAFNIFVGGGKDYHFSWKDSPDKEFTWQQGRKYCQNICMDLASIQTQSDWDTLLEIFNTGAPRIQIQTESEYQTT